MSELSETELFDEQLEKAKNLHGEVCGGIVSGTKMAIHAMKELNMDFNQKKNKDLIVFLEIDRCMADAIQAVTGCSLGKRTLKLKNYGKFAATFYKISTGEAIRIASNKNEKSEYPEETIEEKIKRVKNTPSEELFNIQKVKIRIDENELPGRPRDEKFCSICSEQIMDSKQSLVSGRPVCKSCHEGSYYEII